MNLREWRRLAGLTQDELGALIVIRGRPLSASAISRYETGERIPHGEVLIAIARLTKGAVSADTFVEAAMRKEKRRKSRRRRK